MMERITHSACELPDGRFYLKAAPACHHDVFRMMSDHGFTSCGTEETGFWTSENRYVDREEAWRIAEAAGQLLDRAPTDGRGGTLYSEEVW